MLSPAERKTARRKRLKRLETSAARLRRALLKGGVTKKQVRALAKDD